MDTPNNENVNSKTSMDNFSCEIPYIGWNQEEKSSADVKFNLEDGGSFQSSLKTKKGIRKYMEWAIWKGEAKTMPPKNNTNMEGIWNMEGI